MQNTFYLIAVLLIIVWGIGFFVYSLGAIIHLLLIIAVVSIVLRMLRRDREKREQDKNVQEQRPAHNPGGPRKT